MLLKEKYGNVECEFEITNYKEKIENVFSFSFFRFCDNDNKPVIDDAYFKEKYVDSLSNIMKIISYKMPEYTMRIYYDNSTELYIGDLVKGIKKYQLYKYNFPDFQKDGIHKLHFGSIMRYFPLFDFKYHGAKNAIVFDIDNMLSEASIQSIKGFAESKKYDIIYRARFCYLSARILLINKISGNKKNEPLSIISSYVQQLEPVDNKIFVDFLNNLKKPKYPAYDKYLKDLEKHYDLSRENMRAIHGNNGNNIYTYQKFGYGIDEFFMNIYYIKYLMDNKKKIVASIFNNDINKNILSTFENIFIYLKKNKNLKKYVDFIREVGVIYRNNPLLKKDIITIENMIALEKKMDKINLQEFSDYIVLLNEIAGDMYVNPRNKNYVVFNFTNLLNKYKSILDPVFYECGVNLMKYLPAPGSTYYIIYQKKSGKLDSKITTKL